MDNLIDIKNLNKKVWLGAGTAFFALFSIVDYLNMPYTQMSQSYGFWLVFVNITLNLLLSIIGGFMATLSDYVLEDKGIKTKGDNLSFLSVVFGIFTYGCTPCLISFLAIFGINFSAIALPFAGLPYKFISLGLMILGVWILIKELKRKGCAITF